MLIWIERNLLFEILIGNQTSLNYLLTCCSYKENLRSLILQTVQKFSLHKLILLRLPVFILIFLFLEEFNTASSLQIICVWIQYCCWSVFWCKALLMTIEEISARQTLLLGTWWKGRNLNKSCVDIVSPHFRSVLEVTAILSVSGMFWFFVAFLYFCYRWCSIIYIPEPFQCTQHTPLTAHPTF